MCLLFFLCVSAFLYKKGFRVDNWQTCFEYPFQQTTIMVSIQRIVIFVYK